MLDVTRTRSSQGAVPPTLRTLASTGPAVVTGAGSGIGRAIAVAAADAGFDVALVDIDDERLAATAAGTTMVALVENEDDDAARRVLAVNWYGVEAYLPRMERRGRGSLVTIGSAFGLRASPLQSAYSASKFAVRGYTEALQTELIRRSSPVRVHCVHPGAVRTAIADDAVYTDDAVRRRATLVFDRLLPATSPSSAAETVLTGVARGRRRILVGADARLIDVAARVTGGPGRHRLLTACTRALRRARHPSPTT